MTNYEVILKDSTSLRIKALSYSVFAIPLGVIFYADEGRKTIVGRFCAESVAAILGDSGTHTKQKQEPEKEPEKELLSEDFQLNTCDGAKILQG